MQKYLYFCIVCWKISELLANKQTERRERKKGKKEGKKEDKVSPTPGRTNGNIFSSDLFLSLLLLSHHPPLRLLPCEGMQVAVVTVTSCFFAERLTNFFFCPEMFSAVQTCGRHGVRSPSARNRNKSDNNYSLSTVRCDDDHWEPELVVTGVTN